MEQQIDSCYYNALRTLRCQQIFWLVLQVLQTLLLTVFTGKYHYDEPRGVFITTILAIVVGWLCVIKEIYKVWEYYNFDLAMRVAAQTQHCIEVPVDLPSRDTLSDRLYPAYNLQASDSEYLSDTQKQEEERALRVVVEKVYESHCVAITILSRVLYAVRLVIFVEFALAILRHQVVPPISRILTLYCIIEVLFIGMQLCALLICLLSPCIITCVVCLVCCCPRNILESNPEIDAPAAPLQALVYTPTLRLESDPECRICFQSFNIGDRLVMLPCNAKHNFHEFCINSWFAVSRTCPMCRVRIG